MLLSVVAGSVFTAMGIGMIWKRVWVAGFNANGIRALFGKLGARPSRSSTPGTIAAMGVLFTLLGLGFIVRGVTLP